MSNNPINNLIQVKKISEQEFKVYSLFASELGQDVLKQMMNEAFMEEPMDKDFKGATFAFYDGRRSLLRSIKTTVERVQHILKENNYDGTSATTE